MAVLKVRKYGDPVLRRRARAIAEVTPEIQRIIGDMTDTMYDEVGVGLTAPQIGISLRLIVVSDEEGRSVQALIDPVITEQGGQATAEEGCLSIPGVFALVTRAAWVKVEARDADGRPVAITVRGLRARVLQHELDHLDGVLFIDRLDPVTRDRIKRKIKKEGLREDAARHAFAL
jgi:peptide deformylase